MTNPYQHLDISDAEMETITSNYPGSSSKLVELIKYWQKAYARGVRRDAPLFGQSPEGLWVGDWHRKLNNIDIQVMTTVLRYRYSNSKLLISQYDLNLIQGLEDLANKDKKCNIKQTWRLAMLLLEFIVEK